ncbi:MAG: alpha-mannosidase, partial [bacterium]|nr:alpha-mannosidase [bacterium]
VTVHRSPGFYNAQLGGARKKIELWLDKDRDKPVSIVLWGVGDHGGGPSRRDLADLAELIKANPAVVHSTPEAYFKELRESGMALPRVKYPLNPWAVGCYTSQIRIKQKHRRLENEIFMLEKMAAAAALQGLMDYPREAIHEALRDLMTSEFHDILPGSSIQPVEDAALRLLDHGLEIVSRLKARAFFTLAGGQPKAAEGEIPILIYNPHPYPVTGVFECEFQLADQNWQDGKVTVPLVHQDGRPIPCQLEKEVSNLNLDWRKREVFRATIAPGQMTRFDCKLELRDKAPLPAVQPEDGVFHFKTDDLEAAISTRTGLMDKYAVGGFDFLKAGALQPLVIDDDEDPWGMRVRAYRDVAGGFGLMSPEKGTAFSGVRHGVIPSVRVIEDGPVRTVVQVVLAWGDSFICQTYKLPKQGAEVEVQVRVHWNEKNRMLKLAVPTTLEGGEYLGQVAYGREAFPADGNEMVGQQWLAVTGGGKALTVINDGTYGSDCKDGELRLSLLRSPAYSGHPIGQRPVMPQDRYSPRIDQGERLYHFWINGGDAEERLATVDREALARNQRPFALSFFPPGTGAAPHPAAVVDDASVLLTAFKQSEQGGRYIIRLFEPTGQTRRTTLEIPAADVRREVALGKFEIKTLRLDPAKGTLEEVTLLE